MPTKLRAVVVGFGHLGNFHAQKYMQLAQQDEGVELVAIVDPRAEEIRAKAEKTAPGVALFPTLQDYFAACESGRATRPDIASVASTTEHHLIIGEQLLARGVHLLVEKPLASTAAEARRLVELAEQKKLILATGHVQRHLVVESLKGMRGQPYFIECHRLSPFPARSTDIDVILDLMIHDIDLMLAMVASPLKEVHSAGFPVLTPQIDIANCRFEFESGCVANLTSSRISMSRTRKFRIFCADSYLSLDLGAGTFERYVRHAGETDPAKAITMETGSFGVEDALKEEIRDFVRSVREKRPPLVSGADGLRAIEVAEQVVADARRRLQKLSPR
ncbi:MAG: Gfo/Idh/MocA family protein [Bdellovibrionota bacterium]